MSETDRNWVERCQDGHPEDFRHLVDRYGGAVLAYVRGRLDEGADPEGAAQEALVRAFFALPRLRKPESFPAWILGIAHRVTQEVRRKMAKSREAAVEAASRREGDRAVPDADLDLALERAVAELPEVYRNVVLLRFYSGLSCAEVADRLGMPLGSVTKNLSRAYELLRKSPDLAEGSECHDEEVRR